MRIWTQTSIIEEGVSLSTGSIDFRDLRRKQQRTKDSYRVYSGVIYRKYDIVGETNITIFSATNHQIYACSSSLLQSLFEG